MFTDIEVMAITVLSFALGIAITITASFVKGRIIEQLDAPLESKLNYEGRISPFVEIHQSFTDEPTDSPNSESLNRLKKKIESFKHRNRFYKG